MNFAIFLKGSQEFKNTMKLIPTPTISELDGLYTLRKLVKYII